MSFKIANQAEVKTPVCFLTVFLAMIHQSPASSGLGRQADAPHKVGIT